MERIKINLPDSFTFTATVPIRITDLNYGGHVGNDVFLSLIHEARYQFLNFLGFTELDVAGAQLIMADAAVEFKKELYHGDVVKISIAANNFDKIGFDLFYLLFTEVEGKQITVGKAKTGMICYNYSLKKKVTLPDEARIKMLG